MVPARAALTAAVIPVFVAFVTCVIPVFTAFVDAVAHGIEVGASLVGTMRMQGEDMRRARFHLAEEKAARAPSIMILPMALFIMPAVFVIVFVPVFLRYKASRGG